MTRINKSWREQRKAVVMTDVETGSTTEFISVWAAANHVAATMLCKHETAKKEIRKAIKTGGKRYGARWKWKEVNEN